VRIKEIVARSRCQELIELGSGSASKTRALLNAILDARKEGEGPVRYVPLDVSESALRRSVERLLEEYPTLEISGYIGDFDLSLEPLLAHTGEDGLGRLVIFLGGTIGNFTPDQRGSFLGRLRNGLERGDHLLVGVDLVKDPSLLEAAYDDSSGVTARFNKNLLNILNRRLGGEFNPDLFDHRAVYDPDLARVEMWLDSKVAQRVPVSALDAEVPFEEREGMRTEISAKFTRESAGEMFENSGFKLLDLYTDPYNLFGLAFGRPT
jgi:L-histidine N-alpha-methyltransferase